MAINTNTGYNAILAQSILIHSIKLWGPAVPGSTVTVKWYTNTDGALTSTKVKSDTSMSVSDIPYVYIRPPTDSASASWMSAVSTSNTVFTIIGLSNAVCDISLSWTQGDQTVNANGLSNLNVFGGSNYRVIYGTLDGATGLWIPVYLPTA